MVIKKGLVEGKTYFGTLALGWYCYCGDNVKYGLLSNTCFKTRNNMAVGKAIRVTINFYKKRCLPLIKWNKKNPSKQVISITYAYWGKMFLELLLWKVFKCPFYSKRVKKVVVYFGLHESSLHF